MDMLFSQRWPQFNVRTPTMARAQDEVSFLFANIRKVHEAFSYDRAWSETWACIYSVVRKTNIPSGLKEGRTARTHSRRAKQGINKIDTTAHIGQV